MLLASLLLLVAGITACVLSIPDVLNVACLPPFAGVPGVVGVTNVVYVPAFARVLAVADVLAAASVPIPELVSLRTLLYNEIFYCNY